MGILDKKLTPKEKIIAGRLGLTKRVPFFSHLSMAMRLRENEKQPAIAGVSAPNNFVYNPKLVDNLSSNEMKFVICHEVLHLAFRHPELGERLNSEGEYVKHFFLNIAFDLKVNHILEESNIDSGGDNLKGIAMPDDKGTFKEKLLGMFDVEIEDIPKKSSEQIYYEILNQTKKKRKELGKKSKELQKNLEKEMKNSLNGDVGGVESNKKTKNKSGKGKSKEKKSEEKDIDWESLIVKAKTISEMNKGNLPASLKRYIDSIYDTKVGWRTILNKYITKAIPKNFTWKRPSKKSQSAGVYLPSTIKGEKVDVVISVDTSGSVSEDMLKEFVTEIVGIARSFHQVDMTLIVCDCEINEVYPITNGNVGKILNCSFSGGGGTSHIPVYDWVNENKPDTKVLINLTDGYTDIPEEHKFKYDTIWVLPDDSSIDEMEFGRTVKIPNK